ncbi:L-threonylcarbamoyladenylate synthase [Haloglomus halophilum]|uniref:L-threonylcarbamoyladenylate synthase n=1 Tax=Haloglomus halophilum TaxID=2962672 RepID=UPI0020C9D365|nr:L-threonylcarbamoyladenylate synthase [Haloglomus halophilum]
MSTGSVSDETIEDAADRIGSGGLVVYPTETVYGLGADATDAAAVERVFEAKGRSRDKPLSMAVPDLPAAAPYVRLDEHERAFCDRFLPGPVTVVVERTDHVPDELVAGGDRVGLRVPDHEVARRLARAADRPITATSANLSGEGSARGIGEVAPSIRDRAFVVDGGRTPGGGSTVVDVTAGTIHRRGKRIDAIEQWLAEH